MVGSIDYLIIADATYGEETTTLILFYVAVREGRVLDINDKVVEIAKNQFFDADSVKIYLAKVEGSKTFYNHEGILKEWDEIKNGLNCVHLNLLERKAGGTSS